MDIDLELYRREVRVSSQPLMRLSAIDISPDRPQRTFVFLHGFGGQAAQWVNQPRKFSVENRVIAPDLRGHGRSDKPSGWYSMAQLRDDLRMILKMLDVNEKVVLVGHSFGGAIAVEFAALWPERVERLILIGTATRFKLNPLYRFLLRLPLSLLRVAGPFVRNWLSAPPHVLKPFYLYTLSPWDGRDLFRRLSVPTLVIRGHRDLVFEKPMFAEVTHLIPGAEEADIGASGHMVMLERRAAVDRAMERFFGDEAQRSWRDEPSAAPG
ncbi:MAG: alpha/beta fold hydrolase, partial [Chloroflexi bacterium]|nr:alpha/beta fold hydrolase [Chloroflexota bacterium]